MITALGWVRRGVAAHKPKHFEPSPEQLAELTAQADADASAFEAAEANGGEDEEDWEDSDSDDDDDDDDDMDGGDEEEDEDNDDDEDDEDEDAMEEEEEEEVVAKPAKAKGKGKKAAADEQAEEEDEEAMEEVPGKKKGLTDSDDEEDNDPELAKYNLKDYDKEPSALNVFGSLKGLQYYPSNAEDPYITLKDEADSDPEEDDLLIEPTDSIILAAKTEDDISHLEVYVYEEEEENLFLHHEILLPSLPLCLEWLSSNVHDPNGAGGNYVAMGTFQPEIEIWDLNVVDALYPHATLGKVADGEKRKKNKIHPDYHTDAVLGLSWNKSHKNMLASASADKSVKLWDLAQTKCLRSFSHHSNKVQTIAWNPAETTALLSGSFDKTVKLMDVRSPEAVSWWSVSSDVETAKWNPFAPQYFLASTEDGLITYFDARMSGSQPLFTLSAHQDSVCGVEFNSLIPDCLVTCSFDKTVKIWDLENQKPNLVHTRDMGLGKLFASSFCPDAPMVIAVAGGKGKVEVFDAGQIQNVRRRFESRINAATAQAQAQAAAAAGLDAAPSHAFTLTDQLTAQATAALDAEATIAAAAAAEAAKAAAAAASNGSANKKKKNKNKNKK